MTKTQKAKLIGRMKKLLIKIPPKYHVGYNQDVWVNDGVLRCIAIVEKVKETK